MIGETIKDFKIEQVLGRGGMGEVYVATQQIVKTKVAIKLLRDTISHDRQHVQRFFNEAITASKIKHAGIVKIFDVGFHADRAFLIMELLEGEALAARLRRPPRLSLADILDIASQLASILAATHAEHITHRDLKPDNVFLVPDAELPTKRRVKVLDFGIAKLHTPTDPSASTSAADVTAMTLTNSSMGTPGYMAPEQWVDASSATAKADIYSFGCLLFELCCGRPPFVATSLPEACNKHMNEVAPRLRSLAPELPASLDDLVARMLAKSPADRPSSAAVLTALTSPADASTLPATPIPIEIPPTPLPAPPPPAPARSTKHLAILGGGGLALAVVAIYVVTTRNPPAAPPPAAPLASPSPPATTAPARAPSPGCPDDMVRVPAAEFLMGTEDGMAWEAPVHRVTITKPYCVDRTEVTVAAYAACVDKGACEPAPTEINSEILDRAKWADFSRFCNGRREDRATHPVNCVAWRHADAYCRFAGKRLPTEAEWELAARGSDNRRYPWGNERPNATRLNLCGSECRDYARRTLNWSWYVAYEEDDGWAVTAPVGSFPAGASPFGALDMAGNVAEWTADFYADYTADPVTDPRGPATGTARAVRDTSWRDPKIDFARSTNRIQPQPTRIEDQLGFRCARDTSQP